MIDPKLITLLQVYETGNYTRAAERLSLTQPAVSQHIRLLEQDLGVRIFERKNSVHKPTHEGDIVIKYAKRMLALYHNMQSDLADNRVQISSLTVGITHTAESNTIAEALAMYVKRHENVSIKIITGSVEELCGMLKNFEIDLAFTDGKKPDPSFRYLLLDTDSVVLVVSPNHQLARRSSASIDDLRREKLILRLPNSSTRNLFISALECQGMSLNEFNVVLEMDSIATIKDLIRRDFGVSVMARSASMNEVSKGKLIALPIENLSMMMETNLVYHADFDHPELLNDIVSCYNETRNNDLNIVQP